MTEEFYIGHETQLVTVHQVEIHRYKKGWTEKAPSMFQRFLPKRIRPETEVRNFYVIQDLECQACRAGEFQVSWEDPRRTDLDKRGIKVRLEGEYAFKEKLRVSGQEQTWMRGPGDWRPMKQIGLGDVIYGRISEDVYVGFKLRQDDSDQWSIEEVSVDAEDWEESSELKTGRQMSKNLASGDEMPVGGSCVSFWSSRWDLFLLRVLLLEVSWNFP